MLLKFFGCFLPDTSFVATIFDVFNDENCFFIDCPGYKSNCLLKGYSALIKTLLHSRNISEIFLCRSGYVF